MWWVCRATHFSHPVCIVAHCDSNPRSQQASGLRPRGHWDRQSRVACFTVKRNVQRRDSIPIFMPLILYFRPLKIGVICTGMSATWIYLCVWTTFGNGCRTGGSPSDFRRNKLLVRNISVYWCDYRESDRNVWANKLGILAALLYGGCCLSIRNYVMPYDQLFGPVLDYACSIWICATRRHAYKMEVVEQRDLMNI